MMNFKRKKLMLVAVLMLVIVGHLFGQGIKFEQGKYLADLIAQAKAEHKYLFIDCYTTWCGPCKRMDQETYTDKQLASLFDKQFIAAKMQMDKTPVDGPEVRRLYGAAAYVEKTYNINAYPSFLFFDAEGKPIHKATGFRTAKEFLQLVADAQNPDKQYYSILKNYRSGKLDTAELKGLARSFLNQDKELATKIALDYLERSPRNRLGSKDNKAFLQQFQESTAILRITTAYLQSLNKSQFADKGNLEFVENMYKHAAIQDIAEKYIASLQPNEIGHENNMDLMTTFYRDSVVRNKAVSYINESPPDQFFTKHGIWFLQDFTDSPKDKGFKIFYDNTNKINRLMGNNDYAQSVVNEAINNAEFIPVFEAAKKDSKEPDWQALSTTITKKYKAGYADRIVIDGRATWYKFLIDTKKEDKYWTPFIACKLEQIKKFQYDTVSNGKCRVINAIAYVDVFGHGTDPDQFREMIGWMKVALEKNPTELNYIDTYASLLYKAGHVNEAINWESKYLKIATDSKLQDKMDWASTTIYKMKKGEKIWLQKAYLEN